MGTNQSRNQIQSKFENLNLSFKDSDTRDEWSKERKVSKPQKLNRWANAATRAAKQMAGE